MESEENALANADKTVKLHPNNADAYYLRFFVRIDSVNKAKSSAGDACLKFQKNKTEALKADVLTKLNTVIRILEIQVSDSDKALKLNYAKYSKSKHLRAFNDAERDKFCKINGINVIFFVAYIETILQYLQIIYYKNALNQLNRSAFLAGNSLSKLPSSPFDERQQPPTHAS